MDDEEFDIEEMRYYKSLDAKEKLEYLEKMNRFLLRITPMEAIEKVKKLKNEGY